jgi:hypothetical protein
MTKEEAIEQLASELSGITADGHLIYPDGKIEKRPDLADTSMHSRKERANAAAKRSRILELLKLL